MKLKEKIKAYVVRIIGEETEDLRKRENLLEENVRNLNAGMETQERIVENVRNLNAVVESYSELSENVRNLNASIEVQEKIAVNVRNLNAVVEGYSRLEENVRNLNEAMEVQGVIAENVRNLNAVVEGYSRLEENVRNLNEASKEQKVIAENVRNLNAAMKNYSALAENVQNLNVVIESYSGLEENVRNLNAAIESYSGLEGNVRNLNAAIESYSGLEENVRNLNAAIESYSGLEENVRNLNVIYHDYEKVIESQVNNNTIIEKIHSTVEMQKVKLAMLEKTKETQHNSQVDSENGIIKAVDKVSVLTENIYSGIDYFDFENYFRGSMELIKRNQQQYLKYFKGKSNVVDLGCGRGEFLELLGENGINAKGVDLYEEFSEMCKLNGLNVTCDDALHFLEMQQKVDGIFAGQLIEHLTINQLVELCRIAYEKLEEDSCIIMETPNPTCLAIYSHAFYIDPSHNKPVHPLTVKYILEKTGFEDIEIIYTDTSKLPVSIPVISGIEDADKFNDAMQIVSNMLFGSQDYAVIARKHHNG